MAYPTGTYTASELAGIIPEIWSGSEVNDFMKEKLVCANFFMNINKEIAGGGDIFHIPTFAEMTAYSKTAGTAATVNNTSITTINLTVTTFAYCSFAIERNEMQQLIQNLNAQERMLRNAAYIVGAVLEDALIALFAGFSQTQGTSAARLADSDILAAMATLKSNSYDLSECAFFLSPNLAYKDVMGSGTFTGLDKSVDGDTRRSGVVAYIYNIPVYVSSRIGGASEVSYSCLAHKDALIHAETPVELEVNYIPEQFSYLFSAYMRYGVLENRDDGGVWISTAS